jgi:hypothetical protein
MSSASAYERASDSGSASTQTYAFVLWAPQAAAQPPALVIGEFQSTNPATLANEHTFPLTAVNQADGLWELAATAAGLHGGTVYHYWFEVDDTKPGRPAGQRIRVTDPAASSSAAWERSRTLSRSSSHPPRAATSPTSPSSAQADRTSATSASTRSNCCLRKTARSHVNGATRRRTVSRQTLTSGFRKKTARRRRIAT